MAASRAPAGLLVSKLIARYGDNGKSLRAICLIWDGTVLSVNDTHALATGVPRGQTEGEEEDGAARARGGRAGGGGLRLQRFSTRPRGPTRQSQEKETLAPHSQDRATRALNHQSRAVRRCPVGFPIPPAADSSPSSRLIWTWVGTDVVDVQTSRKQTVEVDARKIRQPPTWHVESFHQDLDATLTTSTTFPLNVSKQSGSPSRVVVVRA